MASFDDSQSFHDLSKISDNTNSSGAFENVPLEDFAIRHKQCSIEEIESEEVREALNRQTVIQYRQYAMEKYPKEPIKQEELIVELQSKHFKQYWTNVHLEMIRHQKEQIEESQADLIDQNVDSVDSAVSENHWKRSVIMPASLWTRSNIAEFKANILATQKSNCIKIQSLSVATIRVPTHKEGKCLFWEFATDYYDIGFGLLFEWNINPSDNVTVVISESSDDDDSEEDNPSKGPLEQNGSDTSSKKSKTTTISTIKSNVDELIATYRRECHMDVYCGSHEHPGTGYYILKFDNSYSVWRSKWLYYNVYHTK